MNIIRYPALEPYSARYAELDMEPLEIEVELYNALAGYDPLFLDNLLAACVVRAATGGKGVPNTEDAYALPTPLQTLWRDAQGMPLWAASQFWPDGACYDQVAYWHKRAQSGVWTGNNRGSFTITSTKGRYMERRVPMPTRLAERWRAWCIGNAEEISRLLEPLTHIGKRRSIGYGEVRHWTVRAAPAFSLVRDDCLTRSVPAMAINWEAPYWPSGQMPEGAPAPVGWTPPQWKPGLFAPGWWAGTPVTEAVGC